LEVGWVSIQNWPGERTFIKWNYGHAAVEITRKFDEIVAFSEVEAFIDMPGKRYSSGMYVRLALLWQHIWIKY
jgi:ABC-type polysaccharide/polyol phosphate transport system ATPase subunit